MTPCIPTPPFSFAPRFFVVTLPDEGHVKAIHAASVRARAPPPRRCPARRGPLDDALLVPPPSSASSFPAASPREDLRVGTAPRYVLAPRHEHGRTISSSLGLVELLDEFHRRREPADVGRAALAISTLICVECAAAAFGDVGARQDERGLA